MKWIVCWVEFHDESIEHDEFNNKKDAEIFFMNKKWYKAKYLCKYIHNCNCSYILEISCYAGSENIEENKRLNKLVVEEYNIFYDASWPFYD